MLFRGGVEAGIRKNIVRRGYILNLPRYIDSTEPEDLEDIDAHLRGGIPYRDVDNLSRYWQVFPGVRAMLFAPADRAGYSRLQVEASDIKAAIFGHAEFTAFNQAVTARFETWQTANLPILQGIDMGGRPKALIETLPALKSFPVGCVLRTN